MALQLCASFQIFTDLCILAQFGYYKNSNQKVGDNDFKEKFNYTNENDSTTCEEISESPLVKTTSTTKLV